jgi:hypothetical protein
MHRCVTSLTSLRRYSPRVVSPGIIAGVDFGDIFVVSELAANQEHDDRRPPGDTTFGLMA